VCDSPFFFFDMFNLRSDVKLISEPFQIRALVLPHQKTIYYNMAGYKQKMNALGTTDGTLQKPKIGIHTY
jgi:hypothetical protein